MENSSLSADDSGSSAPRTSEVAQPPMHQATARTEPGFPAFSPANAHVAMLRQLNAVSESFANGSIALAKALQSRKQVVVAANMNASKASGSVLSCWNCTHDDQGLELAPIDIVHSERAADEGDLWAAQLLGPGKRGDALVVCDPWGDHDLLCWAVRLATRREIVTISITTEYPNLLSVLSHYSIRVPATEPWLREPVVTVLRHLVQTAGVGVIPAQKRITGPLRQLPFE